jgi:hypothetical protein
LWAGGGNAVLVCVATAQVVLGRDSPRRWMRTAPGRIGHLFQPQQALHPLHVPQIADSHCPIVYDKCFAGAGTEKPTCDTRSRDDEPPPQVKPLL